MIVSVRDDAGRTRILTALVLGWSTVLGIACSEEIPPEKAPARPVKIQVLAEEGAVRTLEYPGQVDAAQHADMGFEVAGRILEFPVREGQNVSAGQVLARLDPRDYQTALDVERAKYNAAQTEYERVKKLFEANVKSQQELDRGKRNFEVAAANLKTAEKALDDATLVAPFTGRVARKLVRDFRNVQAKEAVLTLVDESSLEIVAQIPERDWALSRPGVDPERRAEALRPRVTVSAFPDRAFPARLKEIATTADPTTRTYAITLSFDKPADLNVMPGMTAKISLDIPSQATGGGYTLPAQAVVEDQGTSPYVWRVDPQSMTVARAEITLGELGGSEVEVRSGLDPGDWIAISGVHQLREGMPVRRFAEQAVPTP